MISNMSDSEEALGSTSKRARASSPTSTVAPRHWKNSNKFFSYTAKGSFIWRSSRRTRELKNCKASNGWWHLLKVVYAGGDEPVKIQCTECDVMMSSINPAARGRCWYLNICTNSSWPQRLQITRNNPQTLLVTTMALLVTITPEEY